MASESKYSPEVRERAVRLVTETRPSHADAAAPVPSEAQAFMVAAAVRDVLERFLAQPG